MKEVLFKTMRIAGKLSSVVGSYYSPDFSSSCFEGVGVRGGAYFLRDSLLLMAATDKNLRAVLHSAWEERPLPSLSTF